VCWYNCSSVIIQIKWWI